MLDMARVDLDGEHRVLLHDVPWATYVSLRDAITSPAVHMTYLHGWLEIMTKGRKHEVTTKQIARLFELFCLERDIPLFGYREMTIQSEIAACGLEPDEWYHRDRDAGEVPDLALEVVVTSPQLDKLEVYAGIGVREVWVWKNGAIEVFALRRKRYVTIRTSRLFPEVDLPRIAHYAAMADQHAALRAFRAELRKG